MKGHLWVIAMLFVVAGCATGQDPARQALEQQVVLLQERQEEMQTDFDQRMSSMEMSLLRQEKFLRDYFDVPGAAVINGVPRGPEPGLPGLPDDPAALQPEEAVGATPAPPAAPAPIKKSAVQPEKAPIPSPRAKSRPKSDADPGRAFYDQALKKYFSGDYDQARKDFAAFESRYPGHPLQANALYWLAETHYAQQQYAQSILVFKELTRRFPQSRKTPDALLKAGYAYERLGDIPNARFHLQIVLDDHPRAAAARLARARIATLAGS